ncbi:TPA: hypothetical protein ACRMUC_004184, partial [Pseudomonas aeruginosa]
RATASLLIRSKRKGQPKLPFPLIGASRSFPLNDKWYEKNIINQHIYTARLIIYHGKYHA